MTNTKQTQELKHTALPLAKIYQNEICIELEGSYVSICGLRGYHQERVLNILNSHYELLEACKEALSQLSLDYGDEITNEHIAPIKIVNKLQQAIKKSGG